LLPDGSNLPLVVKRLKEQDPGRFNEWTAHIQEALPDVIAIRVMEREDDRHLYLKLTYHGGLDLPAPRLSEGTMRILALTLIPFVAEPDAIYLIEEPENGIHPQAIEAVHQVLSQPFQTQILVATHSPVFVGIVKPEELLCFARRPGGPTKVISGDNHPALRDWRREEIDLGTLFAAKVLE
jgi:predicted ATPase